MAKPCVRTCACVCHGAFAGDADDAFLDWSSPALATAVKDMARRARAVVIDPCGCYDVDAPPNVSQQCSLAAKGIVRHQKGSANLARKVCCMTAEAPEARTAVEKSDLCLFRLAFEEAIANAANGAGGIRALAIEASSYVAHCCPADRTGSGSSGILKAHISAFVQSGALDPLLSHPHAAFAQDPEFLEALNSVLCELSFGKFERSRYPHILDVCSRQCSRTRPAST